MHVMQKGKKLPALPKGMIKPTIVTGLEAALGRGNDRTKLVLFLQTLQQNLGAETIGQYVNLSEAIKRLATADGIETRGLIKTEEDLQGEMGSATTSTRSSVGASWTATCSKRHATSLTRSNRASSTKHSTIGEKYE